jgi:hypothetical protein
MAHQLTAQQLRKLLLMARLNQQLQQMLAKARNNIVCCRKDTKTALLLSKFNSNKKPMMKVMGFLH